MYVFKTMVDIHKLITLISNEKAEHHDLWEDAIKLGTINAIKTVSGFNPIIANLETKQTLKHN